MIANDFPTNAEYFRVIDGFPNYDVSTDGRVRNSKTGRIMKLTVRQDGYIRVAIYKDKKRSHHLVHRLVASAFCNKDVDCNVVDHIDHNRANNNYQNLRWTNASGNQRNASISSRNTSGTSGVTNETKRCGWVARWCDEDMKQQSKYFSVKKHGEQAKQMAINYRKQMAEANGYINV